MRIAQVCPVYYPHIGGVETHVKEISERLAKKGFEVEVLTTDPTKKLSSEEVLSGVKVKRFNSWAPNEAYYFSRELKKYLAKKSSRYRVVHAHSYHALPAYYAAISKANNKLVFTPHFHGTVGHTFLRSLLHIPYKHLCGRKIFMEADAVLCCNSWEKNMIQRAFGDIEGKLHCIREPPLLDNLHQLRVIRPVNSDKRTLLCVSRIEKYKGIQYIIKALPHLPPSVQLLIVGKGSFKPDLEILIKRLQLKNRVFFSQDLTKEEMMKCYASADVGILLSFHEQYGLFIAEALASGMPCVVANKDALSEWVDGKNCIGVNYPIKVKEVVQAILSVLDGRVVEVKLPSLDDYVKELQNLYTKICE